MREQDHYAVLEVAADASADEIKRQYRRLMRGVHPDANRNDPAANRKAARLNLAYETLSDESRRREYDERTHPHKAHRRYAAWAEMPDWEDIVAEQVAPRRPRHLHTAEPLLEPEEIEVTVQELQSSPRVRRRVRITNRCDCRLLGDVSTSEPWVWGPIGDIAVGPGATAEFDVEIVSRKVAFPGISRVVVVAGDWTGVIPVRITGYVPTVRNRYGGAQTQYVPPRRRRAVRPR
ncbi:MAG TPA: J domain-containing protein [Dehalococcoidia bacterium]|nr:J domain-containing protein [Dehalococcoidia bacterium]